MSQFAKVAVPLMCSCLFPTSASAARPADFPCRIEVSSDVQVSDTRPENSTSGARDGRGANEFMFEPVIAVNPRAPDNLIIGAIRMVGNIGNLELQTWSSSDGGNAWRPGRWTSMGIPTNRLRGYADPAIGFTREGVAIFSIYGGSATHGNLVSLSTDGGREWVSAEPLSARLLDRPNWGADHGRGLNRGQVYLSGLDGGDGEARLRLLRSRDGRTWRDVTYASRSMINALLGQQDQRRGLQAALDVLISRSGAVVLPFYSWSGPDGVVTHWITVSLDGGATFQAPRQLLMPGGGSLVASGAGNNVTYAIDAGNGPYRDRIYAFWLEPAADSTGVRLLLASSDDQGMNWSRPRLVEELEDPHGWIRAEPTFSPTLPVAQVNRHGVLQLSWYRLRTNPNRVSGEATAFYRRFVTASIDGGESLFPTIPLSDVEAKLRGAPGFGGVPGYGHSLGGNLGHYMKVVADRDGTFHTAFMDARTGTQEIWYARTRVLCGGRAARARSSL